MLVSLRGTEINVVFIFGWSRVLQQKRYGGLEGLQQIGHVKFHPRFNLITGDEEILALSDLGSVK